MGEAGSSDLRHFRDFSFLFHFAELVVFLEGSLALASLCGISLEITTEGTEWPAQDRSITNGSRHLVPTYLRLHGPAEPPEEPAWSFARPDLVWTWCVLYHGAAAPNPASLLSVKSFLTSHMEMGWAFGVKNTST